MSFNLLETTKELFNDEIIHKAGTYLGENQSNVQKAVNAGIPSVCAALIDKASTFSGAESLLHFVRDSHDNNFLQNMLGMFEDNGFILSKGEAIVKNIFGEKTNNVVNAVSQYSGIKPSSSSSLLSMIAPVIIGLIGRHSSQVNMNATGFSALMGNQKNWLSRFIPSGLSNAFGNLGFGNFEKEKVAPTPSYSSTVKKSDGTSRWLFPLLIALIIIGALWYFLSLKGCGNADTSVADTTTQAASVIAPDNTVVAEIKGTVDSLTGDYLYNVGKIVTVILPNEDTINVGEYSTEARLVNFLMDKSATVDTVKGNWFEFTNVRFKTGGAQISDSSLTQLKNFVLIAKAFPAAQFKIGGYTDNTGDSAANLSLSQKRADAVYAKVIESGAAKSSLTGAKGYGQQYPVGDNATVEGRAMNRRVAVNVKAK